MAQHQCNMTQHKKNTSKAQDSTKEEMVNIVVHTILFQPIERKYVYLFLSDATDQRRTYEVMRKDCNSATKDVHIRHFSFVFYQQQLRLLT